MGILSIYLPPFTSDYSGACSSLYDLNALIVLVDASCCTKNYIDYEEPRWSLKHSMTICAQLRAMEAILGDEHRIIEETIETAEKMEPDFIVMLGSPVPAIIGSDMKGIASEIEGSCGIPSIGIDTTGFETYQAGIEAALGSVFERFCEPHKEKIKNSVNILGTTPIDLGNVGNEKLIEQKLEEYGFSVLCDFAMGCSLENIKKASGAELNIAVTTSGIPLAKKMESMFGIPYVSGMPIGKNGLNEILSGNISDVFEHADGKKPMLIVGDQIIANSVRNRLYSAGYRSRIYVGTFFTLYQELAQEGDIKFFGEPDLIKALKGGKYKVLMGDHLLKRIPVAAELEFVQLSHPAISGPLGRNSVLNYVSPEADEYIVKIIEGE